MLRLWHNAIYFNRNRISRHPIIQLNFREKAVTKTQEELLKWTESTSQPLQADIANQLMKLAHLMNPTKYPKGCASMFWNFLLSSFPGCRNRLPVQCQEFPKIKCSHRGSALLVKARWLVQGCSWFFCAVILTFHLLFISHLLSRNNIEFF